MSAPRMATSLRTKGEPRRAWVVGWRGAAAVALALLGVAACGDETNHPGGGGAAGSAIGGGGNDAAGATSGGVSDLQAGAGVAQAGDGSGQAGSSALCTPVQSTHALPARAALYAQMTPSVRQVRLVSELVGRFDSFCAGCHRAPASQGNFSYTSESFDSALPDTVVERIVTDDATQRMPPSAPFPIRSDLEELAGDLQAWLDQGRPTTTFQPPAVGAEPDPDAPPANPYALSERAALGQTNLGDCIPAAEIVGADWDADDDAREELFAGIQSFAELPKKLSQTDLFTLDTETLARHRTVAVAPTYPLWTFDAGKLRYLHLPPGTSLEFNRDANAFTTPPNTRLYKTFSKPVTDKNGQVGWRKIETRLIISRPDVGLQHQAVFGTYIWNDDESEATLLEKPYLGTELDNPSLNEFTFKDLIKPFVTDERVFEKTLESVDQHGGSVVLRPLAGQKEYPVPGWHRCVQCHEGSKDFLLGLTPTQLNRRPLGEGGVYEEPGPDELTQAQRLIDYGFITGATSPDDFIKLEDSAGDRKPRNAYELRAQAYLVGNCSSCHSPRGYPTRLNPSLAPFNFMPGGIVFQFPLEQRSPLRLVKGAGDKYLGLRYLDPSLSARAKDIERQQASPPWSLLVTPTNPTPPIIPDSLQQDVGPWDSLIFRNVQTPRTYDEGSVLYPHMPLHVPGIDCRAQTFLGSWAASVPFQATGIVYSDADSPAAREAADARVRSFLAQKSDCQPAEDLRDWGAEAPSYTDQAAPWEIPDRPHWFEEDFSEAAGDYQPRNGKWTTALASDQYAYIRNFEPSERLRAFAKTEVPFDFWQDKPECDFSQVTPPAAPAYWMTYKALRPDADLQRVYSTLPGAAVFEAICSNCHGPRGTAESNLASTIANLTGGKTRVANYAQGFFGPLASPTQNLSLFSTQPLSDGTSLGEYGAAKYLLFMALGGTEALIPDAALRQVAAAKVASQSRPGSSEGFATANMLEVAKEVCANTIQFTLALDAILDQPYDPDSGLYVITPQTYPTNTVAVVKNGEYLLYRELCAIDNPRPVREIEFTPETVRVVSLLDRASYTGPVNGGGGGDPWCVATNSLIKPKGKAVCTADGRGGAEAAQPWVRRGALNVGYSVFSYLQSAFADPTQWRLRYDECEQRFPRR